LQLLIEEVTDRDFADYMSDQVLLPLDMRQSTFAWDDSLFSLVPLGYDPQGKPVPPYVYPAAASGGLLATLDDVARFASAGLQRAEQQLLQSESLRKMYAPRVYDLGIYKAVTDAYGFGHFIEYFPDRTKAVWHGGQGHGWMTHFHVVPNADAAIVILTNSQRSWPVISRILIDWANWNGIPSIKMGRIVLAAKMIWGFNIFIAMIALIQGIRLIYGFSTGIREWVFLGALTSMKRVIGLAVSLSIIALLTWILFQPYLMITSVFPIASYWTGIFLWIASIVLLFNSLTLEDESS
jgi:CubicO group peptidase (beta-lactamase class C family)